MSYRVDIPTLSANEVYTLTFEYEGTETIQLIVGDLTLETTDRRVVFTTTSPVNYIESNVNLTNLNMYEGYYESDDFGGEYTQESYIEGKSLINLLKCDVQNTNWSASVKLENIDENGRYVLTATGASSGWQNLDGTGNAEWNKVYGTYTVVLDVVECTCKDIKNTWFGGNESAKVKYQALRYNGELSVKYVWLIETAEGKGFGMRYTVGATTQEGRIVVGAMIVKGDYFDEFCAGESVNVWQGIGCVKSPKIVSIGNTQGFGKGGRL